eukprot:CAMPEP_0197056390 /NCGR_PEP_ID=MMETSP1384-20130603/83867_1 /TAXON_ID=29189 /ORGANISM="Ammonia sp." /LENGTH=56 /DNA_ID=CAMNT_0042490353 /DNA_START=102 /DNA_END=269 /DNA_ORIENTATION=+
MAAVESESKSEPYNLLVESVKDAVQDSMHGDYARQHASVENGIEPDVIPANQSQGW